MNRTVHNSLWLIFIAIFVFSFAILGWVETEIFRQAPPIPREVVTTEGQVLIAPEEILNGQNVWQAMGGMESGSISKRPVRKKNSDDASGRLTTESVRTAKSGQNRKGTQRLS